MENEILRQAQEPEPLKLVEINMDAPLPETLEAEKWPEFKSFGNNNFSDSVSDDFARMEYESQPKLISLCYIVKNEPRELEQSLATSYDFADEIIVLDTGSDNPDEVMLAALDADVEYVVIEGESECITEKSISKVKFYQKTYEKFRFHNARNDAKSFAAGKWVIMIDADETLYGDPDALREYLNNAHEKTMGYMVIIQGIMLNEQGENQITSEDVYCRCIRNEDWIKYEGYVHEDTLECILRRENLPETFALIPKEIAFIQHYGYRTMEAIEAKTKRNIGLLGEQIKDEPTVNAYFHRAILYSGMNNLQAAEEDVQKGIFLSDRNPDIGIRVKILNLGANLALEMLATLIGSVKDGKILEEWYNKAYSRAVDSVKLLADQIAPRFVLGQLYRSKNRKMDSLQAFTDCLRLKKQYPEMEPELPWELLIQFYNQAGGR